MNVHDHRCISGYELDERICISYEPLSSTQPVILRMATLSILAERGPYRGSHDATTLV